jgi:hypothetical protein
LVLLEPVEPPVEPVEPVEPVFQLTVEIAL